jgi:putative ABC transport system permease protein
MPAGSVDTRAVPLVPVEVRNLTRTIGLQRLLAALLALSAASAVAHLLTSAIRQRRKELATLRTLGHTPRQAGFALAWAAVSATAFGVVIGTPIGVAIRITAWRAIATSIGIATDSVVSWPTLFELLVASLVLALLISVVPAVRAARLRPAETLRGE